MADLFFLFSDWSTEQNEHMQVLLYMIDENDFIGVYFSNHQQGTECYRYDLSFCRLSWWAEIEFH